jgi:co-chaperonin GroES (HSP10)
MAAMYGDDDTVRRVEQSSTPSANIEPLDDWLTIAPSSEEHETRAGLIIPASAEVPVRAGVVLAVGDDANGIAPGDKVLFPRAATMEVRLGGEPVLLVRRRDLVARFTE